MNEVRALVEAFDAANVRCERCALATIVSVEGSSYRRPGARMLVCEAGTWTGTISAGCLESDVIEHAKHVMRTGEAKLVEYDTASTNDEEAWGLGLGCGGLVRVLVEPLAPGSLYLEALRRSRAGSVSVATVYRCTPSELAPAGARLVMVEGGEEGNVRREKLSDELAAMLESQMRTPSRGGMTSVKVFIETLLPPVPLIVFGAGHDALPVVRLAREVGWHTEVVDPQARPASRYRFAMADKVTLALPEDAGMRVTITPRTMTLLMSHNYAHDLALLKFLLASPAGYIGVMGPRERTDRMLRELAAGERPFRLEHVDLSRLHSPVGLDIGANGPDEIALSIVAEMRAVLDGRRGGMLRERQGSIQGSPADGDGLAATEERVLRVVAA